MMKIFMIVILFFIHGCSMSQLKDGNNYEIAWQAAHLIDVAQTVQIAKHEHCKYYEADQITQRIIGVNPKESDVYKWGVGLSILHYIVWAFVDDVGEKNKNFHLPLRALDTAYKVNYVVDNYDIGLTPTGLTSESQARCDRMQTTSTDITLWRF